VIASFVPKVALQRGAVASDYVGTVALAVLVLMEARKD